MREWFSSSTVCREVWRIVLFIEANVPYTRWGYMQHAMPRHSGPFCCKLKGVVRAGIFLWHGRASPFSSCSIKMPKLLLSSLMDTTIKLDSSSVGIFMLKLLNGEALSSVNLPGKSQTSLAPDLLIAPIQARVGLV